MKHLSLCVAILVVVCLIGAGCTSQDTAAQAGINPQATETSGDSSTPITGGSTPSSSTASSSQQQIGIEVTRLSHHLGAPEGFPTIYQWENGDIWTIFKLKKEEGTGAYFVPSSDDGITWKTDMLQQATGSPSNVEHLTMADIGDRTLIAWDTGHEILGVMSDDQGQTWKKVELELDNDWYPFFFKKSGNELWLLYISLKEGEGGVIKYRTSNDGINWSDPIIITENPDVQGDEMVYGNVILHEIDGKLWLFWDTGAELKIMSNLLYSISDDGGQSWSETNKFISDPEIDDVDPFICEQSNGIPLLIYASAPKGLGGELYSDFGTGEVYEIVYRCYENGNWGVQRRFAQPLNSEHLDWYPMCYSTDQGTMLLAFCSDRDAPDRVDIGGREVYIARFPDVC